MEEISPWKGHNQGSDDLDDYEAASPSGCACFKFFSFNSRRSNDNEYKHLLNRRDEKRETWWAEKPRKVKETTELVARPKWKTSIRKMSGYFENKRKQRNNNKFQYDPQSYALNFDDGFDQEEEEDGLIRGFSVRFAPTFSDNKHRGSSEL